MKNLIWLAVGTVLGYVVASRRGRERSSEGIVADLESKAKEFGAAVRTSYHDRQAELRSALGGADTDAR